MERTQQFANVRFNVLVILLFCAEQTSEEVERTQQFANVRFNVLVILLFCAEQTSEEVERTQQFANVRFNVLVILLFCAEQTSEEVERTQQFAVEVVDLLKHNPQCRMPFNKFIPSYHHHFGKQCKVADYGFTKLTDLFEAIPQILEVRFCGDFYTLAYKPSE